LSWIGPSLTAWDWESGAGVCAAAGKATSAKQISAIGARWQFMRKKGMIVASIKLKMNFNFNCIDSLPANAPRGGDWRRVFV
jgi:hypothetical protein